MKKKYGKLLCGLFFLSLLFGCLVWLYLLDKSLCETHGSFLTEGGGNQAFFEKKHIFNKYLFSWDRKKVYFEPDFLGLHFLSVYSPSGKPMHLTGSEIILQNLTENGNYTFIFTGMANNYTGAIGIYFEDIPLFSF